jgi:ParB family chromosome partitioning protein
MNIKAIRVGRRHRTDVGDITTLAASIKSLGLLHPVVVDGNGRLVAEATIFVAALTNPLRVPLPVTGRFGL